MLGDRNGLNPTRVGNGNASRGKLSERKQPFHRGRRRVHPTQAWRRRDHVRQQVRREARIHVGDRPPGLIERVRPDEFDVWELESQCRRLRVGNRPGLPGPLDEDQDFHGVTDCRHGRAFPRRELRHHHLAQHPAFSVNAPPPPRRDHAGPRRLAARPWHSRKSNARCPDCRQGARCGPWPPAPLPFPVRCRCAPW